MPESAYSFGKLLCDLFAGLVVFLVALPLCLGVALASDAPLMSGVLAGIVGGVVVGLLSGSHTSVSGPAAGLSAVVVAQIALLEKFEIFLLAVMIGGLLQIGLGVARAGFLSAFFPSSAIKGLLAAIGVNLILKQIPHIFGHDTDPDGEMSFEQPDNENTFSAFVAMMGDLHPGAAAIGVLSILLMVLWETKKLKNSNVPAPLVVVVVGVLLKLFFDWTGGMLAIESNHLVQVPIARSIGEFFGLLPRPSFSAWTNPAVYTAGVTIAIVASLETLLNLKAVDKLDPQQRVSPPNRELLVQGIGNCILGLIGGIPMTSVIVRGSVNINAGAKSKVSAVFHGVLIAVFVVFLPQVLNRVPLSCLGGILLVTGFKLASPALVRRMWGEGRTQFIPFVLTVVAIVLSDLLVGVLIGMMVAIGFILSSSIHRPLRRIVEKHLSGEVVHIELADQVSFLNRAALVRALNAVPRGGHVLLDARRTDYIDPDLLSLIRDFKDQTAPARGVGVSLLGFRSKYQLGDQTQYVVHSTRELQAKLSPEQVLQVLKDGHERFRSGRRLTRDLGRQVSDTSGGQHPLAVVLSCIDSRTPAELVFDLGVGDVFSVRIAGNVTSRKVLGSIEYGCAVAGAKLILVMGHTRCGAVTAAIDLICSGATAKEATGCQHLDQIVEDIQQSIDPLTCRDLDRMATAEKELFVDAVARRNVARSVQTMLKQSQTLSRLVRDGRVVVVGAMYNIVTGDIEFLTNAGSSQVLP